MQEIINTAPVLLFVFARPDHTERTLKALAENCLADQTDLIVYADGARTDMDLPAIVAVRNIVKSARGFRSIRIVERDSNYGLARNIIEGVTEAFINHERVIVLEDDLVTSPLFLKFMNSALEEYQSTDGVWHISGWNYPIQTEGLGDAFFLRVMNCWGWATWRDRWKHFEKDTEKLISNFKPGMIRQFDLDGFGEFWSQILLNRKGVINTWAIYWYATIFLRKGLCLNPALSYVGNIGLDGSGTHRCQDNDRYLTELNRNPDPRFPDVISESELGIKRITEFYRISKPTFLQRVVGKLSAMLKRAGIK